MSLISCLAELRKARGERQLRSLNIFKSHLSSLLQKKGVQSPLPPSLHGLPRAADENLIKGSSENGNTSGLNGKELALD